MAEDQAELLRSLRIDRAGAAPARRWRRWPGWALAVVATSALLLGIAWRYEPELRALLAATPPATVEPRDVPLAAPAEPATPAAVTAAPARPANLIASGYVVARRKATLASETTGKIISVLVDEGMAVAAGQVVAELEATLAATDVELARSRADAAEAGLAVIRADLADAERVYSRLQNLSQRSVASEADLTRAQARAEVLRAQLRQAEVQLATTRLDQQRAAEVLDQYKIRAPFAGIVTERSAQPGEMISPLSSGGFTRTGICTIVDMDSIEIEVDVNEAFIGRVKAGGAVEAVLDAYPDWTIPAKVIAIVPTANREKATVKVRIGLAVKDPRILPEMAVKATFVDAAAAAQSGDRAPAALPRRDLANRSES